MDFIVNFILAHLSGAVAAIVGAGVVAVLDFLFALKATWKSNGILHWVYLLAQSLKVSGPSK